MTWSLGDKMEGTWANNNGVFSYENIKLSLFIVTPYGLIQGVGQLSILLLPYPPVDTHVNVGIINMDWIQLFSSVKISFLVYFSYFFPFIWAFLLFPPSSYFLVFFFILSEFLQQFDSSLSMPNPLCFEKSFLFQLNGLHDWKEIGSPKSSMFFFIEIC